MEVKEMIYVEAIVTGSYPFPLDMLLRDKCFPASQGSVTALEFVVDSELGLPTHKKVEIKVGKFIESGDKEKAFSIDDWEHYLWTLTLLV